MSDRTTNVSVSLYQSQIDKIKTHVKENKQFKSEASFFQHIIDNYFKKQEKQLRRDLFVYLVIPGLFWMFSFFAFYSTQGLEDILFHEGMYFNELHMLKLVFMVFTFLMISIFAVSIYLLKQKYTDIG